MTPWQQARWLVAIERAVIGVGAFLGAVVVARITLILLGA